MKKIVLVFAVVLIAVFSCKSEKKETTTITEVEEVKKKEKRPDNVIVKIQVEYLEDDHIQLFYIEELEGKTFTGKNSFKKEIIGKQGIQEVIFEFPKEIYPERLRIDFGSNSNLGTIKIEKILISREDNIIVINQNNFQQFFSLGANISTSDNYQFNLEIENNHYDPHMMSRLLLNNELIYL